MWALFGPADPADGGFSYALRDRDEDLDFSAYSGASGPAYGAGVPADRLRPTVLALEALLATTPPADCGLDYVPDVEYGAEPRRMGVHGGVPFDRAPPAPVPTTHDERLALVKRLGGAYGMEAGWSVALDRALPPPPAFVRGGVQWVDCVAVDLQDGVLGLLFDVGRLEKVPVTEIPWDPPLDEAALAWIASWEQWRRG